MCHLFGKLIYIAPNHYNVSKHGIRGRGKNIVYDNICQKKLKS